MPFESLANCPVCHARVSLQLAWDLAPKNRFGLLAESTGVVCSVCSTKLRITQTRSVVAVITLYSIVLVGLLQLKESIPQDRTNLLIFVAALVGALMFFQRRLARTFAQVQRREGGDTVDFPLERLKHQNDSIKEPQVVIADTATSRDARPWQCRKCREENPAGFELCWNCGIAISNGI